MWFICIFKEFLVRFLIDLATSALLILDHNSNELSAHRPCALGEGSIHSRGYKKWE